LPGGLEPFTLDISKGSILLRSEQAGRYVAVDDAGRRYSATLTAPSVLPLEKAWSLTFPAGWGAPSRIQLEKLASWSESQEEGIRHFSGTATYSNAFEVPSQFPEHAHVHIELGEVRETARISLNGKEVGVLWKTPFSLDITSAILPGTNTLSVQVTNLWPNRLIGDQSLPENKRFTHTNITKFTSASTLLPSGLLGPVRLTITGAVAMVPNGRTQ
jgi:hypothetical protein